LKQKNVHSVAGFSTSLQQKQFCNKLILRTKTERGCHRMRNKYQKQMLLMTVIVNHPHVKELSGSFQILVGAANAPDDITWLSD
jgi:hypothetical protein